MKKFKINIMYAHMRFLKKYNDAYLDMDDVMDIAILIDSNLNVSPFLIARISQVGRTSYIVDVRIYDKSHVLDNAVCKFHSSKIRIKSDETYEDIIDEYSSDNLNKIFKQKQRNYKINYFLN